jgi:hypothetical protein
VHKSDGTERLLPHNKVSSISNELGQLHILYYSIQDASNEDVGAPGKVPEK